MRRSLRVAAVAAGAVALVVAIVLAYAALSLNSVVNRNRAAIIGKLSDALARPVEIQDAHASLGWGLLVDVTGVKVGDDPQFSQLPFVTAGEVYIRVNLIPLIFGRVSVSRVELKSPEVRLIRDAAGNLNLSTIGKKRSGDPPASSQALTGTAATASNETAVERKRSKRGIAALAALSISRLAIQDGQLSYRDATGEAPLTLGALDLAIEHFGFDRAFDVELKLAALGDRQNLHIEGKVGPLAEGGEVNASKIPMDLALDAGPILLDKLRTVALLAGSIPARLSMPDPIGVTATIKGDLEALDFDLDGDLSAARVLYIGVFAKPAGVPLKFSASGSRSVAVAIKQAHVTLADLELKAADIDLGGGAIHARIDTNRFGLASVAKLIAAAAKYDASGDAELHATVRGAKGEMPNVDGAVTLAKAGFNLAGSNLPGVKGLSGDIKLAGSSATIGPLAFELGSGHGRLAAQADSIKPLHASFNLTADDVKLAELVANRPKDEEIRNLAINGTAAGALADLEINAQVTSSQGNVASVPYANLALSAGYEGRALQIRSFKLSTYDGSLDGTGDAKLGADAPQFSTALKFDSIDLEKMLKAQQAKAANTVRGKVGGSVQAAGSGAKFDQIKPTLRGNGRVTMRDGKLVGVNVVGQALSKADIPGLGQLVPASVAAKHPALFKSPDTQIDDASLTFQIVGPRITTHDLTIRAPDYTILGDGWFDMDKNVAMSAQILLSKQLSGELQAQKKEVAFIENPQGQVAIPLQISGALPKPTVVPDTGALAQRAASRALQGKLGGLLGKKGGGLFPGSGGSGGNPLAPLQKLFH